eukprot:GFKZ01004925.1.p2 GENE.GFKZ01004925.1~~GFKZ01004925.1.p2  ORF type:complete len:115 (-),score=8.67 GFKZ01004925.1:835-1179(-)
MKAPVDVFKFPPLGGPPSYLRCAIFKDPEAEWNTEDVRSLCPPVDLIGATVKRLARSKALAILLVPDWPWQPRHQAALRMASRVERVTHTPAEVWKAQQKPISIWILLPVDVHL